MEKVRVALVGVGVMGSKYAQMLAAGEVKQMTLAGVVARRPEVREWAAGLVCKEGRPAIYADVEDMFAHAQEFDAVIIATPHKTHEDIAVRAWQLGKHVLCDKPAGITIRQAQSMETAARESGRLYGMIFHQRKYPKYCYIKKLLEEGSLGEIKRILVENSRYFRTTQYHRSGSWRSSWTGEGGGALMNQGAHLLDMWQWLFGMPQQIYANIPFGKYNAFQVDDEATIQMHYTDGTTGVFILTTGEAVWQERMEIVGTKGRLLLEEDTLHIFTYNRDVKDYIASENVNSREHMTISEEIMGFSKGKEPYAEMLENFAEAVLTDNPDLLTAPGTEALNQLMLTNAAYYSAWNHMPVTLPLDADVYERAYLEHCEK